MGINYQILEDALQRFSGKYGRGADAFISQKTGLDPNIIGRTRRGKTKKPTIETWDKIHEAFPEEIPPPEFDRVYKKIPSYQEQCPLLKSNSGCIALLNPDSENQIFVSYILDDSMAPILNKNDLVVVDKKQKLRSGGLCYIQNIPQQGRIAFVRRFHKYGDNIVLKTGMDDNNEIVLTNDEFKKSEIFRVTHSFRNE